MKSGLKTLISLLIGSTGFVGFGGTAAAWDPATTQAGLAEKAGLASKLHQTLAIGLGRPLGLFEPVSVSNSERKTPRMKILWPRLGLLSSSEGYRPSGNSGTNPALSWVAAGAALEAIPAERGRHHFFDPKTGKGLHDNGGASGGLHSLKLAFDGSGGLRGLATGTTFDLTGRPALGWLLSADNDLGLPQFLTAMERTVGGSRAEERQASLADALLCLGAMGAVLADMGEPAHVRNDFQRAFLGGGSAGSWDQSSDFERFVSRKFGRAGVPEAVEVTRRPTLPSFFSDKDGLGLADRTQAQFFSEGTVPPDIALEGSTTPGDVRRDANDALPFTSPAIGKLSLRDGRRKYQTSNGVRVLAYERLPTSVRFFLDEAVFDDVSTAWLPVVTGYVAGLYDNLLRAQADIAVTTEGQGRKVVVTLRGVQVGGTGTLKLYAESADGLRRLAGAPKELNVSASDEAGVSFSFGLPEGASRVAVSVRGQDAAGAFVAVADRAAH